MSTAPRYDDVYTDGIDQWEADIMAEGGMGDIITGQSTVEIPLPVSEREKWLVAWAERALRTMDMRLGFETLEAEWKAEGPPCPSAIATCAGPTAHTPAKPVQATPGPTAALDGPTSTRPDGRKNDRRRRSRCPHGLQHLPTAP